MRLLNSTILNIGRYKFQKYMCKGKGEQIQQLALHFRTTMFGFHIYRRGRALRAAGRGARGWGMRGAGRRRPGELGAPELRLTKRVDTDFFSIANGSKGQASGASVKAFQKCQWSSGLRRGDERGFFKCESWRWTFSIIFYHFLLSSSSEHIANALFSVLFGEPKYTFRGFSGLRSNFRPAGRACRFFFFSSCFLFFL